MFLNKTTVLAALLVSFSLVPAIARPAHGQQVGDKKTKPKLTNEQRIRAALEQPCELDYMEKSLADVVQDLSEKHKINVRLRNRELEAIGLDAKTAVSIHVNDISLRSALALMLDDLELTWAIRHEVLLITSKEEAESLLTTKVYDVKDLVYRDPTEEEKSSLVYSALPDATFADFDGLIQVITSTIEPDSWDEAGGPGSVDGIEYSDKAVLVFRQTEQVHQKVAALLEMLRKVPSKKLPEKKSTTPADKKAALEEGHSKVYARVYPISAEAFGEPEGYAKLVRAAIEPKSWNEKENTHVSAAARTIVVRHNKKIQKEVQTLLQNVGAIESYNYGSVGYGGYSRLGGFGGGKPLPPQGGGFSPVAPQK